jgi:tetratricopeptide (TPR) repeat protein
MLKTIPSVIFFVITSLQLYAQKCKPFNSVVSKEDGKTYTIYGASLSTFGVKAGFDEFTPYLLLNNDGSASYITLFLNFTHIAQKVDHDGKPIKKYEVGSGFELFFQNGESIYIKTTSVDKSNKGLSDLKINLSSRIKNIDIKKLAEFKLEKIKILPFLDNKDFFNVEIKKSKSEKLQSQFSCFNKMKFDNSELISNPRKSESLMKLGDTYLKKGMFTKSKEYYTKSIEAEKNFTNQLKLVIVNVALNDEKYKLENVVDLINSIRSGPDSDINIEHLEGLLNNLIMLKPNKTDFEEILLLLLE